MRRAESWAQRADVRAEVSQRDDFRDWTGFLHLVDGRDVTAFSLSGDALHASVGAGPPLRFDRKTGCAATGEQIDPAELYRIQPETYVLRERARRAFCGYAPEGPAFDSLPVSVRQRWLAAADNMFRGMFLEPISVPAESEIEQRVKVALAAELNKQDGGEVKAALERALKEAAASPCT